MVSTKGYIELFKFSKKVIIFHSLDILNKNTDSQATMAQIVEHATAARTVAGSTQATPSFMVKCATFTNFKRTQVSLIRCVFEKSFYFTSILRQISTEIPENGKTFCERDTLIFF